MTGSQAGGDGVLVPWVTGRHRCVVVPGGVFVPSEVAALWAPVMRSKVREMRGRGAFIDERALGCLAAFERSAEHGCGSETTPAKPAGRLSSSECVLQVQAVAAEVGVSEQAVRRAARERRLHGHRFGRTWTFERDEVARWKAERDGVEST